MSGNRNLKVMVILFFFSLSLCFIPVSTYAKNKPNIKIKTLAQVKKPILTESGRALWSNVANAKNYQVQLYLDSLPIGAPKTVNSGKIGYDFLTIMRTTGKGSYTVKVKAKGDGKTYSDGLQSVMSNTRGVTKALVKDIDLSRDGIATWKSTNAVSFDLKLYKNGNLVDTYKDASAGYNFLDLMRSKGAGKYTITVTPYSDAGLVIDGDESPQSKPQIVSNLNKINRPVWKSTTITWKPDANASFYEVKLYNENDVINTQIVGADKNYYDFGDVMSENPEGLFKVIVKAKGSGLYLYGEESEPSFVNVNPPQLAPIEQPLLSSYGYATWADVANATNYKLQLYHDGEELGSPQTVVSGETGFDFLPAMQNGGPGSYTYSVTAKGDGSFHDGEQSPDSNEQVVGPQEIFNGTVENTYEPAKKVSKNRNNIIITSVYPNEVQAGQETEITMEVEYNLEEQDIATLTIFSNWGPTSVNRMETTFCDVYKGSGKLLFKFKVIPKYWNDGEPFWVSASLVRANHSQIASTKNYNFKLKKSISVDNNIPDVTESTTVKEQPDFSDMKVTDGIIIETDGPAYYMKVDSSKLPASMANWAKYAVFHTDYFSDDTIKINASELKKSELFLGNAFAETYYRGLNDEPRYQIFIFYDKDLNFIGYYIYDVKQEVQKYLQQYEEMNGDDGN
ncbi:MAG TPA: hypothetical protein VHT34_11845 [Clostridia bacterium]|nr:hypothetical protein [Clostridia bacterium]